MSFIKRGQQGLSLLELTLALVVSLTILMAIYNKFQRETVKSNAMALSGSVALLMSAMNDYYYDNCQDQSQLSQYTASAPMSVSDLQDFLKNTDNVSNPLDPTAGNLGQNSFAMYYDLSNPAPLMILTVSTDKSYTLQKFNTYVGLIAPDSVNTSARQMTWQGVPDYKFYNSGGLWTSTVYQQQLANDLTTTSSQYRPANTQDPCSAQ